MKNYLLTLLHYRKLFLFFIVMLFSLSVFAQPAYDNCATAKALVSSTVCNNNANTLNNATVSVVAGATNCAGAAANHYDVWFRFTALSTTHTATISGQQAGFTNPEVAFYSGVCGALVEVVCASAYTATASGLTIGNVYYVRVSRVLAAIPANCNFNICITHAPPPPVNDNCAGAVTLTSNINCNNTASTLRYATASVPVSSCSALPHYDVWFRFTAVSLTHIATINNLGAGITNPSIAIYSGVCGSLVQISCANGTTTTASPLTVGAVYYVRVSNLNAAITANTGAFDICITHPALPANDLCVNATLLTSTPSCTSVTGNIRYATSTHLVPAAGGCGGATAATTFDVWYRFVANSTMHSVYLSNLGSNLTAATTYIEVLSGACGALTSLSCQSAATRDTVAGLTPGNTYYVRVYVTTSPLAAATINWNFDICIQQPPVNDICANATILTPGATCVNTAGTLDLTIPSVLPLLGCRLAGTYFDVWYRFTAASLASTITISGAGINFAAPRIIVYTAACGGAIVGCASAFTYTPATAIGTVYYVQIANFGVNPWSTSAAANFNICVTNVVAPPGNDLCSGSILLTSGLACSNVSGTIVAATASAPVVAGGCGLNTAPDVWYHFVAQSAYPIINLSNIGPLMRGTGRLQFLTGSCASLIPIGTCFSFPAAAAATLNTVTNPGGSGFTIGQTYYIRITNSNAAPLAGTYTFDICITDPVPLATTLLDYAKSYVNISDGQVGGTINVGDTLEIRATMALRFKAGNTNTIDSVAYYDTLKAGCGLTLIAGTIAVRTNEGKLYKLFGDAYGDSDAGWTAVSGSDNTIQINLGPTATNTVRGKLRNYSKPMIAGPGCMLMATYRVRVTSAYNTKVNYGGGAFVYRDSTGNFGSKIALPNDSLMVYQSQSVCPQNTAQTNILGEEFNGTFGAPTVASAATQNRGTSANTNYAYAPFAPQPAPVNGPQDYFYAIANNTAQKHSINQSIFKPDPSGSPNRNRLFTSWDITGDHTNATDPLKGNKPCDTLLPVSATNPCGYMLLINSAYRTDVAFNFSVSNACPNTYYEISSWIKNMCYICGNDSNNVNSKGGVGYIPTVAGAAGFGDSAGVRPNIAYEINGVDYYTTGDIPYKGLGVGGTNTGSDTLNSWVKKSFVYLTGMTETNFTITLRNNAPGGGGNDWAIDDISLKTCFPSMSYSPANNTNICANGTLTIGDTIRSLYNTYTQYKWQRSINGGVTWVDIAGTNATASPTLVNGLYQYISLYTVPPVWTTFTNNGDLYRVVVASTIANLANGCFFSEATPITISIDNCLDIDDDNDGIPDYVEFNNPVALQDANTNGIPNWNDPTYAGYVDNNIDSVNDNFDWGADSDNDGIPNYLDLTFGTWLDSNADGVNDNSDKDLDGIPNQLDKDSDNDGIPDVVESYGVDTNGNGIIDNYTDPDGDGFSQNVDSTVGVNLSGIGLGAPDLDGDGIPNYLDSDSDNDGIPDLVEVSGIDANNNAKIDVFLDLNYDGFSDNDSTLNGLLITGADINNNGRADDWPNKNLDRDLRPNAFDLDSDGDGIVDVIEAGLPDVAPNNGIVDGVIGANGWSTTVSVMPALNLYNTDGIGNFDFIDIDSDEDGIPDNIEGQTTAGYALPTLTDADGDGLMLPYDNTPLAFGGYGILVYDHDADATPDYRDLDTDADGQADRVEGNDYNLNGIPDDNVTPMGIDGDGDGLDDRYDSLNSVTNIKGTSYRMGNGGSFTGDATPGARTPVQRTLLPPFQLDRDWRFAGYVLPVQFVKLAGQLQTNTVALNWTIIASKEVDHFEVERSLNNTDYVKVGVVNDPVKLNEEQRFAFTDDISGINNDIIYYKIKVIGKTGEIKYSNVLIVRRKQGQTLINMMPNPATNYVNISINTDKNMKGTFSLIDKVGKRVFTQQANLLKGSNNITLNLDKYSTGVYALIFETLEEKIVKQLLIIR